MSREITAAWAKSWYLMLSMTIDEIKEQIATSLDACCDEQWFSILDHTTPGHYGVEDLSFRLASKDLWIDVPQKAFYFKNGTLSFSARLGSSREEDAIDINHSQLVSGLGTFDFDASGDITVGDLEINEEIDLLERSAKA
jgi:hypothetical protein